MKLPQFLNKILNRKKKENFQRQRKNVYKPSSRFANDRIKKVKRNRFVQLIQVAVISLFVLTFGGIIISLLAGSALSLKTGAQNPILKLVTDVISKTPFASFLVKSQEVKAYDVVGIYGVPEFPGSEFVFADSITREGDSFKLSTTGYSEVEREELYRFLSNKQSVYYLPLDASWKDVIAFYKEKLPEKGWSFAMTAPIDDLEKVPGEYFIKENQGLHLYTVSHDIWYEVITKEQAETGLRDRVVAYKAKQYLVDSASGSEFPTETWWGLRYTNDWEFSMNKHPIFGEQQVYLRHKKTNDFLNILIMNRYRDSVSDVQYAYLQQVGQDHIRSWLATQPPSVSFADFSEKKFEIAGQKAVEYASDKNEANFTFLVNEKNKILYVIEFHGKVNKDFYEYLTLNLRTVEK